MKNNYSFTRLQRLFLLLFFTLLGLAPATAQLTVSPVTGPAATHADQLAQYLVGQGVVVTNAQLTGGANNSVGFFNGTNSNIGIGQGVLLTSGDIANAVGPNGSGGAAGFSGGPTIPILNALLAGQTTQDGVMLEFDVQVASDTLRFEYVFASEEYPEWACSGFNDVFGFFISGPGVVGNMGAAFPGVRNIAYLPGTNTPVTINNVNDAGCGSANVDFYVANGTGTTPTINTTVQYDGFTVVLTAEIYNLTPCAVYHLQLAIADVGDTSLDSGVFIKQGSLTSQGIQFEATTAVGSAVYPNALEGCINGGFGLKRVGDISQPQTVEFSITGTAENGFDYFDPNGVPLDSTYTFAAGQDTAFIEVWAYPDGIDEPQETVIFILKSSCVNIVTGDSAILYIDDKIPLDLNTNPVITGPICEGTSIQINAHEPGFSGTGISYFWSPSTGLSDDLIPNPVANPPVGTTEYFILATVGSAVGTCTRTDSIEITVEAAPVNPAGPDFFSCTAVSGTLQGSGGGTYSWVGPNNFTSAQASPTFMYNNPGNYILHVTTPAGCEYTDTAVVSTGAPLATIAPAAICVGQSVTLQPNVTTPGNLTYVYSPATGLSNPNIANPVATPNATTTYTLTMTDANNCVGTAQVTVTVNQLPQISAGTDIGVCPGEPVALSANAPAGATFTWTGPNSFTSNVQTPIIPNAAGANGGIYSLSVTDANGCTSADDVTVTIKPLPQLEAGAPLNICAGDQITIPATATTGSAVTWSPAGSLSSATALQPVAFPTTTTTYTATANLDGCETTDQVTITVTPAPMLSISSVQPFCLGQTATVTATDASTGLPGTTYAWTDEQGTVLGTANTISITPATAGNVVLYYTATPTNAACTKTDSVVLEVKPMPQFSAGQDLAICPQETVELQATETTGASVTWSPATGLTNPNIVAPIASPSVTTTYTATANLNGCEVTDMVTVTANPAAEVVASDDQIRCWNVPTVTLTAVIQNAPQPGVNVTWAPIGSGNVASGLTADVSPTASTDYVVTATLGDCATRDTISVTFVPDMNLGISVSPEGGLAPLGVQFTPNSSNTLVSWMWDFDVDNLNTDVSDQQFPTYTYVTPGEYEPTLIATDNMGCVDTASYTFVRVSYGVPNVFTPNGDGFNDLFNVGILKANTKLRVLSRWGKVIFESDNYQNNWDAAGVPDGVYFYQVTFPDSGEDFKGWVEIHR